MENKVCENKKSVDEVRLWEEGWKTRYYKIKFEEEEDVEFRTKVSKEYIKGLCWVLLYYYQGCASWEWFYPFHYAPFASDISDCLLDQKILFPTNTTPFRPLEQLMAVMPSSSGIKFLPESWSNLMHKETSPIIDFYPKTFRVDLNGKKFEWMGVVLLPFIDQQRLLSVLKSVYPTLTKIEKKKNAIGHDLLFVSSKHPLFQWCCDIYVDSEKKWNKIEECDKSLEFSGFCSKDKNVCLPGSLFTPILHSNECPEIKSNQSISVFYKVPKFKDDFIHQSKLLPNSLILPHVLSEEDILTAMEGGIRGRGRGRGRDQFVNNFKKTPASRMIIHEIGRRTSTDRNQREQLIPVYPEKRNFHSNSLHQHQNNFYPRHSYNEFERSNGPRYLSQPQSHPFIYDSVQYRPYQNRPMRPFYQHNRHQQNPYHSLSREELNRRRNNK